MELYISLSQAREKHESLIELFEEIMNSPLDWEEKLILSVWGFLYYFQETKLNILLELFSDVFAHTDVLSTSFKPRALILGFV